MKIVLVTANEEKQGFAPLGILYLASYLRENLEDVEVKAYDYLPSAEALLSERADLIGFSAVTLNYAAATNRAKEIRKDFGGVILLGGVHVTLEKKLPECYDVGILGEGEITLCELIQSLKKNKGVKTSDLAIIPGLIYRDNDRVVMSPARNKIDNLDILPLPARELLDMKHYLQPNNLFGNYVGKGLTMISSRGCAYHCNFCSSSKIWGRPRYHSAGYVVDEMEYLKNKYDIDLLYFADDNFSSNIKRMREIAALLKKKSLGVDVGIMGRVDFFNDEIADLYKKMGVKSISVGIESGSERMINLLKNDTVNKKRIEEAVTSMVKNSFEVSGCFMIGSPTETEEEIKQTISFADNLPLSKINFYISTPFYGTDWWDIAVKQDIVPSIPTIDYWSRYNLRDFAPDRPIFKDTVSREKLKELYEEFTDVQKKRFYFDWKKLNER